MSKRSKNIVIFMGILLIALAVYAWYYPLNKGKLNVSAGLSDYLLFIDEISIPCNQDPCTVTLKTGARQLKIQKDEYFPETINVYIKRGKSNEISIDLKKIPTLNVSPIIPPSKEDIQLKKLPEKFKNISMLASAWDTTGSKLAFIDQNDNRLKIWNDNEGLKLITTLKNIEESFNLYWSPNHMYLFGNDEKDIYFINIAIASRKKKILNFNVQNITWSLESDYLLANDENNNLYKIIFDEEKVESLETTLNLKQAVWSDNTTLIFFVYDKEKNKTVIQSYSPISKETKEILTKFNFPVDKIGLDKNFAVYFYNSDTEMWYGLNY